MGSRSGVQHSRCSNGGVGAQARAACTQDFGIGERPANVARKFSHSGDSDSPKSAPPVSPPSAIAAAARQREAREQRCFVICTRRNVTPAASGGTERLSGEEVRGLSSLALSASNAPSQTLTASEEEMPVELFLEAASVAGMRDWLCGVMDAIKRLRMIEAEKVVTTQPFGCANAMTGAASIDGGPSVEAGSLDVDFPRTLSFYTRRAGDARSGTAVDNCASTAEDIELETSTLAQRRKTAVRDQPISMSDFELVRVLGKGGFGKVFLARHIHDDRSVLFAILLCEFPASGPISAHIVVECPPASMVC